MPYSRDNPSPRYRELTELYRRLHREGERNLGLAPEETYPGVSLLPHLARIKALIDTAGARTVLDYGCGKGMQYEPHKISIPGDGEWDGELESQYKADWLVARYKDPFYRVKRLELRPRRAAKAADPRYRDDGRRSPCVTRARRSRRAR